MISVLTWCYSRQDMLDITLPLILKQEGVEFEVIVGHGPDIVLPNHPKVRGVPTPVLSITKAYNLMLREAKGDTLFITQCDMQITSPTQLKRMYDKMDGRNIVTEKFFKQGKRDIGVYLQCCMARKEDVVKAGGWCEGFDDVNTAAYEDADLVASLLENGLNIDHLETPADEGVYHIDHPRPDYEHDPVLLKRLAAGKALFWSRHKEGIMSLYGKQVARALMQRRVNA